MVVAVARAGRRRAAGVVILFPLSLRVFRMLHDGQNVQFAYLVVHARDEAVLVAVDVYSA